MSNLIILRCILKLFIRYSRIKSKGVEGWKAARMKSSSKTHQHRSDQIDMGKIIDRGYRGYFGFASQ